MKTTLSWPRPKNWEKLWPALKGSLAKVYKPCIRPSCPHCASGEKHPAYIFSFSQGGERRCMYLPESLVPAFEKALSNGRRLEALLYEQGPLVLKEFRRQRDKREKAMNGRSSSQSPKHPENKRKMTKTRTTDPSKS